MIRQPVYADLAGKVVAVVGAGGGIGHAIAEGFAIQGSKVAACGRSEDALRRTVESIEAAGAEALAVRCDITSEADVEAAIASVVSRFGVVDVFVNSAATSQMKAPVDEMLMDEWNRVMTVNLTGAMLCAKHVARRMSSHGSGAIVNIASLGGTIPRLGLSSYGASKAAVIHLTRVLALEMAPHGVRVNAISPGATDTPMLRRGLQRDHQASYDERAAGNLALFRSPIPLQRVGTPAEIAAPTLFLASEGARFITGQVLQVDGGESLL